MSRRVLTPTASFAALIAAVALAAPGRASAAEPPSDGLRVIGSDATARFVALEVNKSLVIDLPRDVRDVLVADPKTVKAIAHTSRRFYIIAAAAGETNVYFFDAAGKQIGALDVGVTSTPQPAPSETGGAPKQVVDVYQGGTTQKFTSYSCTLTACITPQKASGSSIFSSLFDQ